MKNIGEPIPRLTDKLEIQFSLEKDGSYKGTIKNNKFVLKPGDPKWKWIGEIFHSNESVKHMMDSLEEQTNLAAKYISKSEKLSIEIENLKKIIKFYEDSEWLND